MVFAMLWNSLDTSTGSSQIIAAREVQATGEGEPPGKVMLAEVGGKMGNTGLGNVALGGKALAGKETCESIEVGSVRRRLSGAIVARFPNMGNTRTARRIRTAMQKKKEYMATLGPAPKMSMIVALARRERGRKRNFNNAQQNFTVVQSQKRLLLLLDY